MNIEKHRINSCYVTSRFEKHSVLKDKLLTLLQNQTLWASHNTDEKITKTDWYVPQDFVRDYWNLLHPEIDKHIKQVYEFMGMKEFNYTNHWCNMYDVGDFRGWHNHIESSWAHVYYVDLPDKTYGTEIKSDYDGEILKPAVEEGMILSFPSGLQHRSPEIKSENKIIIAFNTK
jgi:hypothetical protein